MAYDLGTQGKLLWEQDGNRATGTLAGAFFLSAPLAIDNTLFVSSAYGTGSAALEIVADGAKPAAGKLAALFGSADVKRMRKTGMTVRELARHFGVSHVTIIDRLKR